MYNYRMLDLTDRRNVFYWQTDRNLSSADFERIFLKRHEIATSELERVLRQGLTSVGPITSLTIDSPDSNVTKGNVNIVRKIQLNQQPFVVRMHPPGVKNGYFFVEQAALTMAHQRGLPVPRILEVHTATDEHDMDFVLMEAAPGTNMDVYLQSDKTAEAQLLRSAGETLARIHELQVEGYGAFNNNIAQTTGKLIGHHASYHDFIWVGLPENIQRLISFAIISPEQGQLLQAVFERLNFEPPTGPRLIHNDFADWNLLTDGQQITAVLDWDECHAGDPIADLACWSTFYDLERFALLLAGYEQQHQLPADFEQRFHFYRLRYTISKMALRAKRAQVDKSDFIREKLAIGTVALQQELAWFKS